MMNFCTLFDAYYIHKGLALYRSLEKVTGDFTLYVMAFDEETFRKLKALSLPHMVVENESGPFLTEEIAACKAERKRNEYCWTCGSNVTWYFLTRYGLDHIVYVDADMMFFHDPSPLFKSLEGASVGLSPHFFDNGLYGRYCVQFVFFRNDTAGRAALSWWKDQCIAWCYDRYENGLFGDQVYLDRMPERFAGVKEIEDRGCGVAPWNEEQYRFLPGNCIQWDGKRIPVYFFHFHGIGVDCEGDRVVIRSKKKRFRRETIREMFVPYGNLLKDVYQRDLGRTVSKVVVKNPSLIRRAVQACKDLLRDNPLVRKVYFKYLKGHTGYNRKQDL